MTHTRYAFVKANWHSDIVDQALKGFLKLIPTDHADVFDVPGAFELLLMPKSSSREWPTQRDCLRGICGQWRHLQTWFCGTKRG